MTLRLTGVSVRYDGKSANAAHATDAADAVHLVDLEVGDGERLSILGPSGSGKSTLLRAICGLEPLAAGRVEWDGADLAEVPVHRRGFGLMFQDYALFAHMDVAHNVSFGPEMERLSGETAGGQVAQRAADALALVRLSDYGRRFPSELSGGEQQRVALARAIAPRPRLLMLDEPLGALDRSLRRELLDELIEIFTGLNLPIVYVTHDHEEALAVGDRVAVMRGGRIEALSTPRELWRAPPTEFVARFLGFNNILDAQILDGHVMTRYGTLAAAWDAGDRSSGASTQRLLIRPDAFAPHEQGSLNVVVRATIFRGDYTLLRVVPESAFGAAPGEDADGGSSAAGLELEVHADWSPVPKPDDRLRLRVDPAGVVLLGLP